MPTMRNYKARPGSRLTLDNQGECSTVDLYSREGLDMLSNLWVKVAAEHRLPYEPTWLGRPIIQFATDVVAIQELLWKVQPDVVIETGVAHGGSLMLSAMLLELLGRGKVIGIDIEIRPHNRAAIEAHPLSHKIELIEGPSTATDVVATVQQQARRHGRVMVLLDSNHTHEHVLAELEAYAPLVSEGSYCVVFDTVIERLPDAVFRERPWGRGNNPMTAVQRFLSLLAAGERLGADGERLHFEIDRRIDAKLLVSVAPSGYLRRVRRRD